MCLPRIAQNDQYLNFLGSSSEQNNNFECKMWQKEKKNTHTQPHLRRTPSQVQIKVLCVLRRMGQTQQRGMITQPQQHKTPVHLSPGSQAWNLSALLHPCAQAEAPNKLSGLNTGLLSVSGSESKDLGRVSLWYMVALSLEHCSPSSPTTPCWQGQDFAQSLGFNQDNHPRWGLGEDRNEFPKRNKNGHSTSFFYL